MHARTGQDAAAARSDRGWLSGADTLGAPWTRPAPGVADARTESRGTTASLGARGSLAMADGGFGLQQHDVYGARGSKVRCRGTGGSQGVRGGAQGGRGCSESAESTTSKWRCPRMKMVDGDGLGRSLLVSVVMEVDDVKAQLLAPSSGMGWFRSVSTTRRWRRSRTVASLDRRRARGRRG